MHIPRQRYDDRQVTLTLPLDSRLRVSPLNEGAWEPTYTVDAGDRTSQTPDLVLCPELKIRPIGFPPMLVPNSGSKEDSDNQIH